mmetsp:Transcript_30784/g.79073  ORF Transcript_30784/g.79073 Transcript_30784/m.79073 type:complete len:304 (-) Transcript_30784:252-1163(-)|eukprot:jgi/Tetstr1/435557/TSEL_024460.t1
MLPPLVAVLLAGMALPTALGCSAHNGLPGPHSVLPRRGVSKQGGVVIWSWGRCGTGTLYETMLATATASNMTMQGLCGIKEGLHGDCIKDSEIDRCLSHVRHDASYLTHIKPHYVRGSRWPAGAKGLMTFMQKRGTKVVVVVKRDNWLARDVSAVEMHIKPAIKRGQDPRTSCDSPIFKGMSCPGNCVDTFRRYQYEVDNGIKTARKLGLRVVPLTFTHANWPCGGVSQIMTAAAETGVLARLPSPLCVEKDSHTGARSHLSDNTLEGKLGTCMARRIRKELKDTEYEWMLDLTREAPPGAEL